jgi:hypothetical protein
MLITALKAPRHFLAARTTTTSFAQKKKKSTKIYRLNSLLFITTFCYKTSYS